MCLLPLLKCRLVFVLENIAIDSLELFQLKASFLFRWSFRPWASCPWSPGRWITVFGTHETWNSTNNIFLVVWETLFWQYGISFMMKCVLSDCEAMVMKTFDWWTRRIIEFKRYDSRYSQTQTRASIHLGKRHVINLIVGSLREGWWSERKECKVNFSFLNLWPV